MASTASNTRSDDLARAVDRLFQRRTFGVKFGLGTVRAMSDLMAHPERAFDSVHVAGTNGKGAVCAMLASVFESAELTTGLYTSPHLVRVNERIRVNGIPIPDTDLAGLIASIERVSTAVQMQTGAEPTFFECITLIAFEHFRRSAVRIAAVETGMGGRLDATNILNPLAAVITSIGLEHTAYLGPDIPSIAAEKCGIIKERTPVIAGNLQDEAMAVVERIAAERGATLWKTASHVVCRPISCTADGWVVEASTAAAEYGRIRLPQAGTFAIENLCTVLTVVDTMNDSLPCPIDPATVKRGLARTRWPGRFQRLDGSPTVILDCAHNPPAARELAASIKRVYPRTPVALVSGMCTDKDASEFLNEFAGLVRYAWLTPLATDRTRPAEELQSLCAVAGIPSQVAGCAMDALESAKCWARDHKGIVVVAGSIFLIGELMSQGQTVDLQESMHEKKET